jgi:hypothetical protein
MKSRQFVNEFRAETGKHLAKWFDTLKHDESMPLHDIDLKGFIDMAAKKPNQKNYWNRFLHKQVRAVDCVEFEIDGAFYRILNKPTALAFAYKHANRAI